MTPTLHPSRHRVDTFLVNEPLLPWSLRESVWARGMAHPQVVGSDHLPVRLALPGLLNTAAARQCPPRAATRRATSTRTTPRPHPSNTACGRRSPPRRMNPPWRPGWVPQSSTTTGPCPRPRWTTCSSTSTRRMTPWRVWWDAGSRPRRGRTRQRGTSRRAESGSRQRSSAMTPWQRARRQRTRRRGPAWHPVRGGAPAHGGAVGCVARVPPDHAGPAAGGAGEASSRPRGGHSPAPRTPGGRPQASHQGLLAPPPPRHRPAMESRAGSHRGRGPGPVRPLERAGPEHPNAPQGGPRRDVRSSRLLARNVSQTPGGPPRLPGSPQPPRPPGP